MEGEIASLVGNIQHKTLSPNELARAYERLLNLLGSREKLAARLGVSLKTIYRKLGPSRVAEGVNIFPA